MRLRASAFVLTMLVPSAALAEGSVVDAKVQTSERPYFRGWAAMAVGTGLRFNNPYRLSRPLGDDAESLSMTAPYGTLGVGTWLGSPDGLQHGPILRYDRSLSGVTQHVLTPSYGIFHRGAWLGGWARFGVPILLSPDPNVGGEVAFGGAFYVRAGIAVTTEVIGDLFWGAATPENKRPIYPVLSGQLGLMLEWEQLP
jgi:hypothetical protein